MEAGPGGTGPTAAVAAPETWQDRFVDSTGVVSQVLGERALSLIAHYTGAADKAVNLVGCKSPHHQLPGQVVSISDACGGNEACSARM